MYHKPVLLRESVDGLSVRPGGIYIDATYGGGGHSRAILERLDAGRLIAFDQDQDAMVNNLGDKRFLLINRNYRYLIHFLRYLDAIPVDGILADLGISSHQIDQPGRGFSTRYDSPIDLRMNKNLQLSARDILADYDQERLRGIFAVYGELEQPGRIAELIVSGRKTAPIETTGDLRRVLRPLTPSAREHQFLAQVHQALRIEVNAELVSLQEFLQQALAVLKPSGRLAVISYHSLEDRIVKNFMRTGNTEGVLQKDFYGNILTGLKAVNRRPITPSPEELSVNPRARSAKLRIAEKLAS